jgi:EAL and modified HD-GYP domain-containing signal transduction protein
VNSVKQALSLLGEDAVRKWATLIAIGELGEDRPQELLMTCMVRARLCELLAPAAGMGHHARDLFLVGLLSLLDTLVGRPLPELIAELGVSREIHDGVLEDGSSLGRVRELALGLERGDWDRVATLAGDLKVCEDALPHIYGQAGAVGERGLPTLRSSSVLRH